MTKFIKINKQQLFDENEAKALYLIFFFFYLIFFSLFPSFSFGFFKFIF